MAKGLDYWIRLVAVNPARIVAYFEALTYPNRALDEAWVDRYGHDKEDVTNAASAMIITLKKDNASSASQWKHLVEASITETILQYILRSPFSESMSQQQIKEFAVIPCIEILQYGAQSVKRSPSGTSRRFSVTIRTYWNELMKVLWGMSDNTPYLEKEFGSGRVAITQLLVAMIALDESFVDLIVGRSLTISVITSFLMHATEDDDIFSCITALTSIPTQSYPADLFDRLCLSITHCKFIHLFEKLAQVLDTSGTITATPHATAMLLSQLYPFARELSRATTDLTTAHQFVYALHRSPSVFSRLFDLVNTSLHATEDSVVHQLFTPGEVFTFKSPILSIILLVQCCAAHVCLRETQEDEAFIRTCIRAGLVDMLERLMLTHFIKAIPHIGNIIIYFTQICRRNPKLLPLYRREFPRPRLMHACLQNAYSPDPQFRDWVIQIPDAISSTRKAWLSLESLETRSRGNKRCARRECKQRRVGRCKACKKTEYCSVECQRLDWPEHRLVCGFEGLFSSTRLTQADFEDFRNEDSQDFKRPKSFPFRFGDVDPL